MRHSILDSYFKVASLSAISAAIDAYERQRQIENAQEATNFPGLQATQPYMRELSMGGGAPFTQSTPHHRHRRHHIT